MRVFSSLVSSVLLLAALGCQTKSEKMPSGDPNSDQAAVTQTPPNPAAETPEPESPFRHETSEGDDEQASVSRKRRSVAEKAKDALFTRLSARLTEVMQSSGPAAAIDVCSNEALSIADTVGKEHGVSIGRTSFKLRNPVNRPREWVKPFVEKRSDTPQYLPLDNGSLGALFPIHLKVKCLMCHGQQDDILDDVKAELAKRYPNDEATGFKLDELRGWFWVEVPATMEEI